MRDASTTILVRYDSTWVEAEAGRTWAEALALIWSGEIERPKQVVEVNLAEGRVTDLTDVAAVTLADRTWDEQETPAAVKFLCDPFELECWEEPQEPRWPLHRQLSQGAPSLGLEAVR